MDKQTGHREHRVISRSSSLSDPVDDKHTYQAYNDVGKMLVYLEQVLVMVECSPALNLDLIQ